MPDRDVTVDGVRLGPQSDFVELFRNQFLGKGVFASKSTYGPEDSVASVLGASEGSNIESRVKDALMALVVDPDTRVRAGAVMAIGTYPETFKAETLFRVLNNNLELFRGVPALARGFPDLEWEIMQAVAALAPKDIQIMRRFKSMVFDPTNGGRFVGFVARADPRWLLEHAREVTIGQPARVDGVFAGLPDAKARETYTKALRDESQEFRGQVIARLPKTVPDPVERERLAKLLSE